MLAKPSTDPNNSFESKWAGADPLVRFEVSVTGRTQDVSVKIDPLNMPEARDDEWRVFLPEMISPYRYVHAVDAGAASASLRVGVATGAWTTVASEDIDLPELPAIREKADQMVMANQGTGFTLDLGPLNDESPSAKLMFQPYNQLKPIVLAANLKGVAIRCVAVLKNGRSQELRFGAAGIRETFSYHIPARHGEWGEGYNNLLASDIAKIQIQTRPYEWAEFDGIALKPAG